MKIQVTTIGRVQVGEFIAAPDDESYPIGGEIPANDYLPEDQDWRLVTHLGGHADVGWVTVFSEWGEEKIAVDWSQKVWRYMEDDETPVRAQSDEALEEDLRLLRKHGV